MEKVSVNDVGRFLVEYTAWLWGCGATCLRTQKNVGRIAAAYGYDVDLTIMPGHVTLSLKEGDNVRAAVFTGPTEHCGINFDLNTRLSALSWSIADAQLSISDADNRFSSIIGNHYGGEYKILVLTSLANASFCRLFGGDAAAMGVVFGATLAGYFVKQKLLGTGIDNRVVFFICALVSSVLCAGASILGWGSTPGIALATSVLYLIPGVPYINAASDLIDRHYLCSFSRFADAAVLTAALSAGLCLGLSLMQINTTW